jgi:PAS domain-containing protein
MPLNVHHYGSSVPPDSSMVSAELEKELKRISGINEELLLNQARLLSIIDGTNVGTWEWNVQTGETVFNERWLRQALTPG